MRLRTLTVALSLVLALVVPVSAAASGTPGKQKPIVIPLRGTATATTVVNLATGKGTSDGTFGYSGVNGSVHVDVTSFRQAGSRSAFKGNETDTIGSLGQIFGRDKGWGELTAAGSQVTIFDRIVGGTGFFRCAKGWNVLEGTGTTVSVNGSTVTQQFTLTAVGRLVIRPSC
jgi:hypothetical protein